LGQKAAEAMAPFTWQRMAEQFLQLCSKA